METVLYEYTFDFANILLCFIPLVIGVVFLTNSIKQVRQKVKNKGWNGLVDSFFKYAGFVVGTLCIFLFLTIFVGVLLEHKDYVELIDNNEVCVIEGYVEEYHPMPYEGHDTEHFEIDGVYFEYSDYNMVNGYNISASHGGVVTHNGQHLRIKYIQNEYDGVTNNVIIYIAQIENESANNESL